MGTGFAKKKKEARMLQEQFSKMEAQMQNSEFTGKAGGGLVTVVLTGNYEMKSIQVKPDCVDKEDLEGLQDLIKAAYADALNQIKAAAKLPEGMPDLKSFGL